MVWRFWEARGMLVRLIVNACALLVAGALVPGIHMAVPTDVPQALSVAGVALLFAVVNSFAKPIVKLISLPFLVVTLGLFLLVVNAGMLLITSWASAKLGLPFQVDGWGAAIWGSIVVSVVSFLIGSLRSGS